MGDVVNPIGSCASSANLPGPVDPVLVTGGRSEPCPRACPIRVNVIAPGFVDTPLGRGVLGDVRLLGDRTMRHMTKTNCRPAPTPLSSAAPWFAAAPFDGLGFSVTLGPQAPHTLGSAGEFAWSGAARCSPLSASR